MDKTEKNLSVLIQEKVVDEHLSTCALDDQIMKSGDSDLDSSPKIQVSGDCLQIERQNELSSSVDKACILSDDSTSVNPSALIKTSVEDFRIERLPCVSTSDVLGCSVYVENSVPPDDVKLVSTSEVSDSLLPNASNKLSSEGISDNPVAELLGGSTQCATSIEFAGCSSSNSSQQKVAVSATQSEVTAYSSASDQTIIEKSVNSDHIENSIQEECCSENVKNVGQNKNSNPSRNEVQILGFSDQVEDNTQEKCSENVKRAYQHKNIGVCLVPYESVLPSVNPNEALIVTSDESRNDLFGRDYRDSSDSSVTDLTSSSEDESITEIINLDEANRKVTRKHEPTCRGEFLLSDLPPIEDLNISVPEGECSKIGVVSSIVGELVVIQSLPNIPALDVGTVLFLNNGSITLGRIFDVLGQVKEPFYTVRFNSEQHVRERGVTVGADVYCAPKSDHTAYIFVSEMMKMRGSDASWEHNNEPPPVCLDYSDDEEERLARRALANQKHGDDKDNGPPRKKRGVRQKMGNSNNLSGRNQRGNFTDSIRPEVSPVRGCFPQSIPHLSTHPPIFPQCSVFPPVNSRRIPPPCSSPVMFGPPPPNFSHHLRAGFHSSLFGAQPRNFQPSVTPRMPPPLPPPIPTPPPYFIRPFHVLPPVPLIPLSPVASIPSYVPSPHVRPILCQPRFQAHVDDKNGPANC